MFQHQGIWLPDGEKHFPEWMTKNGEEVDGKGTYQIKKLRAALEYCKRFRVAVDVGAHVGLWSMHLVKRFQTLHAFEPMAAFRECFARNVPETPRLALLYPVALAECAQPVAMNYNPADSGGTHVERFHRDEITPADLIQARALDEYDFQSVDFIKLDCEGFEHRVLEGARETLIRCRPCVIVEQKPHKLGPNFGIKGTPAVDLLKGLGAEVRREIGGDYIMTWAA